MTKRRIIRTLALAAAAAIALSFLPASAQAGLKQSGGWRACTEEGTRGDDNIGGNGDSNVACGYGGNDYLNMEPFGGADIARGGPGDDVVITDDGVLDDRANGGVGNDTCIVDAGDLVAASCETVIVS